MSKAVTSAPRASRPFRILALPLARLPRPMPPAPVAQSPPTVPDPTAASSSTPAKTPLMLFHVLQPDPAPEAGPPSLLKRGLDKASDTWYKLGQKDKKSVSYWFYKKGEGLMDKIEYEEWALKAIQENQGVKIAEKGKEGEQERIEIPLLKPIFEDRPLPTLLPKLHRFLIHRIPYHRKMMWRSLIATPLTAPFAIIPIIPNFPFFYVLWRAWSHYKAWRGALYLETLLKLGMISESPSKELDSVYQAKGVVLAPEGSENSAPDQTVSAGSASSSADANKPDTAVEAAEELVKQAKGETTGAPDGTATPDSMVFHADTKSDPAPKQEPSTQGTEPSPRHPSLLLSTNQVPMLAKTFDLRSLEVLDITRAIEQASIRARKIDKENSEKQGSTEAKA